MEWVDEVKSYNKVGFGVTSNLSLYDLDSLEDSEGVKFLQKYKDAIGSCPVYRDGCYEWMEVKVKGFDKSAKMAVVERTMMDDVKKVSRLSIRFNQNT